MKRSAIVVVALSAAWFAVQSLPRVQHLADAAPSQNGFPAGTELRVLGSNRYMPGTSNSLRIISYDASTGKPVAGVPVEIRLEGSKQSGSLLFQGQTNALGTLDGHFKVPANASGSAIVRVASPCLNGVDLSAPVTIQEEGKLYLTTDKPLYQPGQSVHVRLLALKAPDLDPASNEPCHIEISDARGNVVFKSSHNTSKFGVASARFDLATEVNMGEYHVKATCGTFASEKSFTVKRYSLPKFKVTVTTDKAYYQPSEKVHGHVKAAYFFGKPVAHGRVALHVKTFDTSEHDLAELEGTTDENGGYSFDVALPEHFTGRPLDKGKAPLDLVAEVVDTANHKEAGPLALSVVTSPISVELFPESGSLIPNLSNKVYVVSSYPDGKPARCKVSFKIGSDTSSVATDATGFGSFDYTPRLQAQPVTYRRGFRAGIGSYPITVPVSYTATDQQGNEARSNAQFTEDQGAESVLLRVDKALYRVGDMLHADVYSTRADGAVYVDMVRDGQTVVSQALDLKNHHATLAATLSPDVSGSIALHAYQIGADQNVIRDSRRIFVQPARNLLVDVKMDKDTYRPGQDARLTFVVKTPQGAPRLAVLGVDVVDESLFSLAESQPGLEKVYFLLEKAMLEPQYEVHGFSMQEAVCDPKSTDSPLQQNLSRALLSKVPGSDTQGVDLNSYQIRMQTLATHMQAVQTAIWTYTNQHHHAPTSLEDLVVAKLVARADIKDPWGHELYYKNNQVFSVGPDGKAGTADDISFGQVAQQLPQARLAMEDGEVFAGAPMDAVRREAPMPMTANAAGKDDRAMHAEGGAVSLRKAVNSETAAAAAPRVREYFPETMYTNPEVVTDENGRATITVPLADSITSWRVGSFASSVHGELGNANTQLRVFQPFFVDIDVPPALTQDDEISVPVAVYNYLPEPQTVNLQMASAPWFKPLDGLDRTLHLTRNQVSVVYYRIRTSGIGTQRLTVQARGTKFSDAIRKSLEVEPNGEAFDSIMSDRLRGVVHQTFNIPKDAIAGASKLLVTVYPGVFAQVMEGMDAIFRMPNGCFEQTSSTTYPNVLVMDYLKRLHRLTPETQMKAEGYINTGYQRLLTFEVKGGGFSVFGQYPGNAILTAYGVMEFADMAKVHDIDPRLLDRTKAWLLAQQRPDGSWSAGREGFYAEGWSNVPNSDLVATAYITWALLNTGDRGPGVEKAVAYVKEHLSQATEPYTTALVANTLVTAKDPLAQKALSRLASMEVEDKDVVYWQTKIATAAFGTGTAGDVETTALAALAMEGDDHYTDNVNKAMTYLTRCKDRNGTWQSTQATVLAMKALVGSVEKSLDKANASVDIRINGKQASNLHITPDTSDVYRQVDLTPYLHEGSNDVEIGMDGKGSCQYKLLGTVYRPWSLVGHPKQNEPLALSIAYDRTHLAKDDVAECTVKVQNLTKSVANQVVVDVGIPPGFDVHDDDLSAMVEKKLIAKYSNTGRQLIIYFEKLDPVSTATLQYHLKARYPIRAQVPASKAYEYYDPSRNTQARPSEMVVQ